MKLIDEIKARFQELRHAPDPDHLHACCLRQLRSAQRARTLLSDTQLDYWGERFLGLHVRFWAGCTFEDYLRKPDHWETIAAHLQHLQSRRGQPFQMMRLSEQPGHPVRHFNVPLS